MALGAGRAAWLCPLLASLAYGQAWAAAGWDCQRGGKDGKEWVCVTGKKKPGIGAETPAAKPRLEVEPAGPGAARRQAQPERAPEAPVAGAERAPQKPVAKPGPETPPAPVAKPFPEHLPAPKAPATAEETRIPEAPSEKESEKESEARAAAELSSQKPGWTCRAGKNKNWDCGLAGADPRGMAHPAGETAVAAGVSNWLLASTITREDEARFSNILKHMPANPWIYSCNKPKHEYTTPTEFLLSREDELLRERSPLDIHSDRAELLHGESSNFRGMAELSRADQRLYGDFVTHNNQSGALNAQGNVIYREKGLSFSSDTAFLRLKTNQGVLRNAQFILETVPARGVARVTHLDSKTRSRYESVSYTTCPPGDQDWLLHADQARIDKETGRGVAKNAWLEFKGVPFLWTPFMSFPVDDRRQSGFLTPSIGVSKLSGLDIQVPYYFNLAPNYDLTLSSRILSKRGFLLRGDFRYLTDYGKGRAIADILPYDALRNSTRGQFGWVNDSVFAQNLRAHVDLHYVSDERYLYELGSLLNVFDRRNIRSWGSLDYRGEHYALSARSDYYQTVDPDIAAEDRPYYRLPQLLFKYDRGVFDTGLRFHADAEAVNFVHSSKVDGERVNLRPRISYPWRVPAGYITPSLALQHTQYWLNLSNDQKANFSDSFNRTAPIFSVDGGTYFERDFAWGNTPMQQTIEPRLFYLYVPKVKQPYKLNFDSAENDFNFYQLFRENRFSGGDRLADANQVTTALTSRLIDQSTGLERLSLSVGKIFYFRDREVSLKNDGTKSVGKSNIVAEVSSALTDAWSVRTTSQWNPNTGNIDRGRIGIQYNNHNNELLNLGYRYRRDPFPNDGIAQSVEQTGIDFRLPFAAGWHAIGGWSYSLRNQVTVAALLGVQRETCCWRFSLIGLRYLNGVLNDNGVNNVSVSSNNAVFFQLDLKGLASFGDDVEQFLARSLSGYRTEDDFSSGSY
jgi:LPS-assembly protein